ncbi:MAG: serine/threonine protein kinase [Mariniblastus sp.]|jgi:serine/threonine protein kinase
MQTHDCPRCGKPIQSKLPGGECPHCLMALAFNHSPQSPTTGHPNNPFDQEHSPSVEKLVSVFPDLEIQHLIGQGGMGAVYQARQINLDRNVALKILSPRLSGDPAFAERFLREARTLAKLSHPNIVMVFDFGKAGDFYFLTMEFVDGVNLRDTISANSLAPDQALAIVPKICDALQYAHDNGVVHRDIKPENILIAKNGNVKIADFGLAKLLQPSPEQFTLTGTRQVLGTRNYMAPEQIENPEAVDHRADLYSLGVVFYELLTGELPLGRFALPSEKSKTCSARLDDVVMRTLEKDPGRRYQQASQIKTACESLDSPQASEREFNAQPANGSGSSRATEPGFDGDPICTPFPVTLEDIYASLASGYGFLRGFETHLELEYEIRDAVVSHKWASSKTRIPLERISWIKLYQGLFYTHIEIQADEFEAVKDLPNSKQGKFRVYLKKRDRPEAQHLTHCVQGIIESTRNPGAFPMPPLKNRTGASNPFDQDSNALLRGILLFLFLGGCCLAVAAIVGVAFWFSAANEPLKREVNELQHTEQAASVSETSEATATAGDQAANASIGATQDLEMSTTMEMPIAPTTAVDDEN